MIRLLFWIAITIVTAYLIDEIRIGDRTIKGHIDQLVGGVGLGDSTKKIQDWVDEKTDGPSKPKTKERSEGEMHPELEKILREVRKRASEPQSVPTKENQTGVTDPGADAKNLPQKEELTEEDQKKLMEILQKF